MMLVQCRSVRWRVFSPLSSSLGRHRIAMGPSRSHQERCRAASQVGSQCGAHQPYVPAFPSNSLPGSSPAAPSLSKLIPAGTPRPPQLWSNLAALQALPMDGCGRAGRAGWGFKAASQGSALGPREELTFWGAPWPAGVWSWRDSSSPRLHSKPPCLCQADSQPMARWPLGTSPVLVGHIAGDWPSSRGYF